MNFVPPIIFYDEKIIVDLIFARGRLHLDFGTDPI